MRRFCFFSAIFLLLSGTLAAQAPGFKSYSSYEAYCFDNPKAPTCVNGKPMKMTDFNNNGILYKQPPTAAAARRVQPARPAEKPLQLQADWRFAHPRAELLAGIDVAGLRESETVRQLLAKLAVELQIAPADLDKMLAQAGGINQAWLSLRSNDVLVLLQGRLELPAGFNKLPNGMCSYRISDSAAVLGREASVAAAVQRLKTRTTAQPAAAARIKELSAQNQLWFIGTAELIKDALKQAQKGAGKSTAASLDAAPALTASALTAEFTGFSVGMRLRDGYHMEALLKFANAAAAQRLLASTSSKSPASALPLNPSAMKLTSGVEGSSVHVMLSIEQAELLRVMDKALASPGAQKLKDLAAAAHKPPAITIQGGSPQRQSDASSGAMAPSGNPSQTLNGITIQGGSQRSR